MKIHVIKEATAKSVCVYVSILYINIEICMKENIGFNSSYLEEG